MLVMVSLIVLSAMTLVASAVATVLALSSYCLHRRDKYLAYGALPISVLKPVKGLDEDFEANLESFCRQNHPCYELIVGAADPNDPALAVARQVMRRYPKVALRVVHGEWPSGHNPKVRNLRNLLAEARHAAILVSDSDVRVRPDYLRVIAGALGRPGVGLVSNLVVGVGDRTLGASCENLRLNGFVAGSIAAAEMLAGHSIVIGKSMLFRRDALTNVGGFAAAANVLAEDYLLGRAVVDAGYRVVTLGHPIYVFNRSWSVGRSLDRHTRWSQIRRHVKPMLFALEPLTQPWIWWLMLASATALEFDGTARSLVPLGLGSMSLFASQAAELVVNARLQGREFVATRAHLLPLVAALSMLAWMRAWTRAVVVWRRQAFRVNRGSALLPLVASERNASVHLPRAA